MGKSKIKFRLVKFEKALIFQVLEMDDTFRASVSNEFISSMGVEIRSECVPSFDDDSDDVIYVRGSQESADLDVVVKNYNTNEERDDAYGKILLALEEWALNWKGWAENKNDPAVQTDIFEF